MAMTKLGSRISNRYKKIANGSKNNTQEERNKKIAVWVTGGIIFMCLLYLFTHRNSNKTTTSILSINNFESLHNKARNVEIKTHTININNNELYYRESLPNYWDGVGNNKVQILLLHGKRYTSSTWKGLGTLQLLANRGYRTIAIDLPGYGLSKKAKNAPDLNNKQQINDFMNVLINKLDMKNVVIICPSWSGYYGIPYLMGNINGNSNELKGFISVASVRTNAYSKSDYESLNSDIPIGIFVGEFDKSPFATDSKKWLGYTLNHVNVMISNSEHAAFVGNPDSFHAEILYFLNSYCKLDIITDNSDETDSNDQLFEDWNQNENNWKDTSIDWDDTSYSYYSSSTNDESSKFYETDAQMSSDSSSDTYSDYTSYSDYKTSDSTTDEETEEAVEESAGSESEEKRLRNLLKLKRH